MERIAADFLGDPRKIDEDLRKYRKDMVFLEKNHDQLLIRYPERWIAVIGEKVVTDSENVGELRDSITELGLESADIYVSFMTKNPPTLILAAA